MGHVMTRVAVFASVAVALAIVAVPTTARADDGVASDGALYVQTLCADSRLSRPSKGQVVSVDGVPQSDLGMGYESGLITDENGVLYAASTPIGEHYTAPAGKHLVRVAADDCAPLEQEVDIGGSTKIHAALPLVNPALFGAAGAPNGFFMGLSVMRTGLPGNVTNNVHLKDSATTFSLDGDHSLDGAVLFGGYVHRHFVAQLDVEFGYGHSHASGVDGDGHPASFSARLVDEHTDARIGLRQAFDFFALEGGIGLGSGLWTVSNVPGAGATGNATLKWELDVPVWAQVMVKPTCDLGIELGATYRWSPIAMDDSTFMFDAGLVFEPNGACSRSPGFYVQ